MNVKLSNQALSCKDEFIKHIESIGFRLSPEYKYTYVYKEYKINCKGVDYDIWFWNGSGWIRYSYNDLTPIENYFKKEFRSMKLKALLS